MKVKFLDAPTGDTMKGGSKEFGEYLISLRDARKQTDPTFSLRGVASKIGISPTYLSKIERGEQPASEKTIRKLAEVFGVSADEIFAHAERIDPNLEKTLAGHEAPAQMAAFLRRVATLPHDKLEMAKNLIDVIDKEKYARLRDILDKVGKTVDDEGARTQVKRDREIHAHYEHAKEKHPVFADILTHNNNTAAKYYKIVRDEAHANGECSPLQVLHAEYAEVLEAIDARDKAQAVYECYDCIAVMLRLIDMIEETAEKEEWKEEARG